MHWDYVCLGEARTVERLILNRSKWDSAFYERMEAPSLGMTGIPKMDESICCTYTDLDRLIDTCGLPTEQRRVVESLMQGYRIIDVAEAHGCTKQAVSAAFRRAVTRIVSKNNMDWEATFDKSLRRVDKLIDLGI